MAGASAEGPLETIGQHVDGATQDGLIESLKPRIDSETQISVEPRPSSETPQLAQHDAALPEGTFPSEGMIADQSKQNLQIDGAAAGNRDATPIAAPEISVDAAGVPHWESNVSCKILCCMTKVTRNTAQEPETKLQISFCSSRSSYCLVQSSNSPECHSKLWLALTALLISINICVFKPCMLSRWTEPA